MSRRAIALGVMAAVILAAGSAMLWRGGPEGGVNPPPATSDAASSTPLANAAPRKPGTLTIAVWNLRSRDGLRDGFAARRSPLAPAATVPAATDARRPPEDDAQAWRTTFGAERRDVVKRGRDASGLAADVVALAGVTHMQDVVHTFAKRDYFTIISRQLLASAGERPATPTTALAILRGSDGDGERKDGLRVMLQDHLLLRRIRSTTAEQATPASASEPETIAAAATAVRLIADGKPLWLLAVDFSADCADPTAPPDAPDCPAHAARLAALATWVASHRDGTMRVIVAGTGAARIRAAAQAGDDVRTAPVAGAAGCAHTDASLALLREPTAPPLDAANARLVARENGERCALLADIVH